MRCVLLERLVLNLLSNPGHDADSFPQSPEQGSLMVTNKWLAEGKELLLFLLFVFLLKHFLILIPILLFL